MKIINLTPHDVTVMPVDGADSVTFAPHPSGPLRLATVDLGTKHWELPGMLGDNVAVPVETVEFHHLLNPPPRVAGTWYIVSLPCALAAPRGDFLVPYSEVRDEQGRIIGCRLLGRPV